MIFENISKLCRERNISISKLEKDCKLGNATIKGWRESSPTVANLQKVAAYFDVSILELLKKDGE